MRRGVLIILVVIGVIGAGIWGVWRYAGLAGASPVEGWIREYLVAVLQRHLNSTVEMGELDYEYPRTVVISQLRLTESGFDFLAVKQVRLELAEIPQAGKPILIERIDLTGPAVQLVKTTAGKLVGWSDLVRDDAVQFGEQVERVEPGMRMSDFMRLRHAGIRDGSLAHRPDSNSNEMVLSGINAELETPASDEGPGWYRLIGKLSRDDLGKITLDGRLDVNTGDLVLNSLHMQGTLDESRYSVFPPSLQDFLRVHQVQGGLVLDVSGAWSQSIVEQRKLKLTAQLDHTRFAQDSRVLTSDRVEIAGNLDGDRIEAKASGDACAGKAEAYIRSDQSDPKSAEVSLRLEQVDLVQLAVFLPEAAQRTLDLMQAKGRFSGEVQATNLLNESQLEVHGKASIVPLAFQIMGSVAEAPRTDLNGTFAQGQLNLDVVADAIQRGADKLATSVYVNLTTAPSTTVIAAQLNAAAGRIQGNFRIPFGASEEMPFTARLDRVQIEEARRLFTAFSFDWKSPLVVGQLTGDLRGSWNPSVSSLSSIIGNLTLAAGQLKLSDTAVAVSSPSLNVKFTRGHLDLDGRLNAAGGVIAGRLGVNLPQPELLTTSGKLESVSLASLLAAFGQRWNNPVVTGAMLDARLTGDFDLRFPMANEGSPSGRFALQGTQGHCRLGELRIPVDACMINADLRDRKITSQLQMDLLGGRSEITGTIATDAQGELRASWRVNDIQLENLSRLAGGPNQGRYRGRLSGDGDLRFGLATWPTSLKGRGQLDIKQGRLIEFPVIHDILKIARPALSLISTADQDEATASFMVRPECVESDEFSVVSSLMAIRGRGRINYDGGLRLVVRATPAPRLTSLLGPLDKLIDDASGRLVTYRVDRTVKNPRVSIEPLGFSVSPGE